MGCRIAGWHFSFHNGFFLLHVSFRSGGPRFPPKTRHRKRIDPPNSASRRTTNHCPPPRSASRRKILSAHWVHTASTSVVVERGGLPSLDFCEIRNHR